MKNLLVIITVVTSSIFQLEAQTTRVLFIGNSYTYFNDLPLLVYEIALANGDSLIVDSYTPGGYSFEDHYIDANTIAKIYSQQWDYVILQEQSQKPGLSPTSVGVWVYPYAEILDSMIHENNPCTETVFYMTWGRENGDATYCPFYPPMCTYEGMHARIRETYMELGLMNNATVSPVGAAWRYMRSLNPAFNLYQGDGSHPSIYGSYLAACTFYTTLFHKSPVGNTFISSLTQNDATDIQNAVHAVAFDSIPLWYEHGNIPMASFSYSSTGNNVQFQNHSLNSVSYSWDFGDGTNSTADNPLHSYSQAGTYTVILTVTNGCKSDVISHQVTTGVTAISEFAGGCNFSWNTTANQLIFDCDAPIKEVQLFEIGGRKINGKLFNNSNGQLVYQFEELPFGIYVMQVIGNDFRWTGKLLR